MVRSFRRNGRKHFGTGSSWERHDHARRQSCNTASQASLAQLSRELGINPKTVAKWRKRATVEDMKTGPTEPRSTVLTEAEEAMVVAFRRHTLLPLDDCLYALQSSIPHLTRSALHRCMQRHNISRLPDVEVDKPKRQKFKHYPIGFFHIDIAEMHTAEGKLFLFVGIDRTSKFALGNSSQQLTERPPGSSCSTCSRPCLTRSIPFSPTTRGGLIESGTMASPMGLRPFLNGRSGWLVLQETMPLRLQNATTIVR